MKQVLFRLSGIFGIGFFFTGCLTGVDWQKEIETILTLTDFM